METATVLQVLN